MNDYPRLKRAVAIGVTVAFAGCATQPANVQPTYVSSMKYDNADCKQLGREAEEIDARLQAMTGTLQTKANGDAALVNQQLHDVSISAAHTRDVVKYLKQRLERTNVSDSS